MESETAACFKPGQKVFLNPSTIPQIEKDFTLNASNTGKFEVKRIITISEECTCGCEAGEYKSHLPLCNLLRIKELGDNRLLTVITPNGLERTHPASWFIAQ